MTNTKVHPKTKIIKNKSRAPKSSANVKDEIKSENKFNPTRYGDWEKGGRCIDF